MKFLIFLSHGGFSTFNADLFIYLFVLIRTPQNEGLTSFPSCVRLYVWITKLNTSMIKWMRMGWGGVPSLGATNFLSNLWDVPNSKYGNQSRLQTDTNTFMKLAKWFVFAWHSRHLDCLFCSKPPSIGKIQPHILTCRSRYVTWKTTKTSAILSWKHSNSCWSAVPQLHSDCSYANRSANSWLRPIRIDMALFLLGSPTYL